MHSLRNIRVCRVKINLCVRTYNIQNFCHPDSCHPESCHPENLSSRNLSSRSHQLLRVCVCVCVCVIRCHPVSSGVIPSSRHISRRPIFICLYSRRPILVIHGGRHIRHTTSVILIFGATRMRINFV